MPPNGNNVTDITEPTETPTDHPQQTDLPDSGEQPGLNISHSDRPIGNHSSGHIPVLDKPSTDTPTGDTPNGDTPTGDKPNGDTPNGNTPNGDTPNGDTPNGDTPNGDTPSYMDVPFVVETASFPGGDFIDRDNQPVQIHPFRMMKTEVTVRQFWSCLSRGICQTYHLHGGGDQFFNNIAAGLPPTQWTEEEFLKDQDPVSHVLYDGARTFCEWIGGRLPTESEWEYAALFDGQNVRDVTYPWGDDFPVHCYHANYKKEDESGFYICPASQSAGPLSGNYEDYYQLQASVYSKGLTPTGLMHMAGNVSEYVDEYIPDVQGDESNICPMYILKGGSVFSGPEELAIRNRQYIHLCYYLASPEDPSLIRTAGAGFRCVFDD